MKMHRVAEMTGNDVPACANNLLDRRDYHFETWARNSIDTSLLISKTPLRNHCRLLRFTSESVVTCFDVLHNDIYWKNFNNFSNLHLAFMGDSRIRQHFFNFLRVSDPMNLD